MTTRISAGTPVSIGAPGANNPPVKRLTTTFVSICPKCGHQRQQKGYTRRVLLRLLSEGRRIDAYCIGCNVCWSISESERRAQMNALAAAFLRPGRNPSENRMTLQLALRTLRGIRQRYNMERAAHPDTRPCRLHVVLEDSDMDWIAAAIEALEKPVAAGVPHR